MSATGPLWHSGSDSGLEFPADHFLTDRGSAYGDALFETVLMVGSRGWLFDRHWARLQRGLQVLELEQPPEPLLRSVLSAAADAAAAQSQSVLKLQVRAAATGRGYGRSHDSQTHFAAALYPLSALPGTAAPAAVQLCTMRLAEQPQLAGIKHCARLEQVLASNEWQRGGYDEGLMCTSAGFLIEATHSNLILQCDGALVTPKLDRCGVAGVLREGLLKSLTIATVDFELQALSGVERMWLCNSVLGLRSVARITLPEQSLTLSTDPQSPQHQTLFRAVEDSLAKDVQNPLVVAMGNP